MKHLTDNNILVKEQYGFRTNIKTDNAIYHLTNEILNALNNNLSIGGIFCDLEKEFNCVNHKILLTKLEFYGITGNHHKLYKSYLMDRYESTLLYNENGHSTSPCSKVEQGVPQGPVLESLLFLLFINDLPKFINDKSVPVLFADDTSILVSHPNPLVFYKTINSVFQTFNAWFKHNLLSLNLAKTHFIKFISNNNNQHEIDIDYDNKSISAIICTKFLGLTVNCSLTLTNHIDLLTKKLSSTRFLFRTIKPYLSLSALKMISHSLFHSIMSYSIMFWGNSPHSPVIFKMQKRVIRILMGIGYRESCRG